MELCVLTDNNTYIDMYYLGEPALSFYLEDNGQKILFDTGYSDVYLKNAGKLGIDLDQVDKIVLSHGHNDHSGGLPYFNRKGVRLIAHPLAFEYKEDQGLYVGSPLKKEELSEIFDLSLRKEPLKLSENLTYLGEIPEYFDFERRTGVGQTLIDGQKMTDKVYDDTALAYCSDKGLFIITGCSHSGICNIMELARRVCNDERIYGVIGGFHLFAADERLQKTIAYFKENDIELIYPCHCVSLLAKIEMGKQLKIREVGVGLRLSI